MWRRLTLLLGIGIGCFAVALLLQRLAGDSIAHWQMQVSDAFMVQVGGPRWGERPASKDIVMVEFDQATASSIGYVHDYQADLKLYQSLVAANVSVVFDTRMVAAANSEAYTEIEPLVRGIFESSADGRVMRDIWLSSELLSGVGLEYESVLVQNVVNSHPHRLPQQRSRIYPLCYFNSVGARESAPLRIVRKFKALPALDAGEVGQELLQSGVMTAWHTMAPDLVSETAVEQRPYAIGDDVIHWFPFPVSTTLVPPFGFWVSYDPRLENFQRYSYVDVMEHAFKEDFAGKIVIIGYPSDIDPVSDFYSIPNRIGKASAPDVLACAVQTILDQRTMRPIDPAMGKALVGFVAILMALLAGWLRPMLALVVSLIFVCLYLFLAVQIYRSGWYADFAVIPITGIVSALLGGVAGAWLDYRSHRRIVDLFGRYVPRAVVQQLMAKPDLEALRLGGALRQVTVLFADIRGFTSYSSKLPPAEVVQQLNSLLEIMVRCTFLYGGTLDKFIGDAILVLFNAPIQQDDHAIRAVRTAVEIQKQLSGHSTGLSVGIGIHSGEAIVGSIGTPQRMEYTAIGSTVNLASRLCDAAKSGQVVVSPEVVNRINDEFTVESLGLTVLRGLDEAVDISVVTGLKKLQEISQK